MMRRKLTPAVTVGLLSAALLLAACAPLPAFTPALPPSPTPWPPLVQAQSILAQQLAIPAETITFVSSEPVEWPNACLGLAAPDEMCAEVITPGYRIVLEAGGQSYVLHTDEAGAQVRFVESRAGAAIPEAASAAQRVLSERLGVGIATIQIISVEAVEWRDGCLELASPGEMCTMALVPGYRVVLEAGGRQYVLHTSRSGSQVRIAGAPAPTDVMPPAVLRAHAALVDHLGLAPEDVRIASVEAVDWSDACLDAPQPGEVCAQVMTPGYKVTLEANGLWYLYHIDENGDSLRLVPAATPLSDASLEWRGEDAQGCIEARISVDALAYGPCGQAPTTRALPTENNRSSQLVGLLATYRSFAASTAAGMLDFRGIGLFRATAAEQRMIAEWVGRVVAEVADDQGLALWGLGWHREGGIAGFCDNLTIDATGYAELSPCEPDASGEVGVRQLTADELDQFYGWLDTLAPFEFTQQDPATADALTTRYIFAGRGTQEATDADKQALVAFGGEVLARWPVPVEVQTIQALADVTIHAGPGEQYPPVGEVFAGQAALVTGAHPTAAWWRVVCPDDTLGNCWVSADPKLTQPVEPSTGG